MRRLMSGVHATRIVVAAGATAVVALAAGIGWSLAAADGGPPPETLATPPVETPAAAATPEPVTPDPGRAAGSGPAPRSGQDASGDAPPPPQGGGGQAEPADPGPSVDYFRVAQEPSCPGGTSQNPIDGRPVALEWRVTGAEQVTVSIDGPGVYDTYPAEGSASFPFPCQGAGGEIQEHTYLLAVVADQPVTATVVAIAEVNDIPQV